MGLIRAYALRYKNGALMERYAFLPTINLQPGELLESAIGFRAGVWLFSNYIWSIDQNLQISSFAKNINAAGVTIHGGPSTPKYEAVCEQFMGPGSSVDVAVRGEGEVAVAEILERLARGWSTDGQDLGVLRDVAGLAFKNATGSPGTTGSLCRTEERPRVQDLDALPSPYLNGVFDYDAPGLVSAILETNRGCPYGCTFCDWGSATLQKVHMFDRDRVEREIEWIARREIPVLWLADANFGIVQRDIELASLIAKAKERFGYPKEVLITYAKNSTRRLAQIIEILNRAGVSCQGVISIQTADPDTLETIRRSNIRTRDYDQLVEVFREMDLPLSIELMYGLPGSTVESFKADLQRYFDRNLLIKAFRTRLLPNSPMADPEYREHHRIELDEDDLVVSTSSFTRDDYQAMTDIYALYDAFENHSLFRYGLRYLQWDQGIECCEFLDAIRMTCRDNRASLPIVEAVREAFSEYRALPFDLLRELHRELLEFAGHTLGADFGEELETVLRVSAAILPASDREFPYEVALEHDFVSYFLDHLAGPDSGARKLADYSPGHILVLDPHDISSCRETLPIVHDPRQAFFELDSPLARTQSKPSFMALDPSELIAMKMASL